MLRNQQPRAHIRLVLPMVDELLSAAGFSVRELSALAFSCGPGSFTGLRIGMGVVQGLAYATGVPVLPVSTLRAMAQAAIDSDLVELESSVMPALDARMQEVYWGLYENADGRAVALITDAVDHPENIVLNERLSKVDVRRLIGIGDGWQVTAQMPIRPQYVHEQLESDAEQVLKLAIDDYDQGKGLPIESVEPVYLRNEVSWQKRQRLRPKA